MARIDAFLKLGTQQGCSDIHLAVGVPPMLRMHGDLMPIKFRELRAPELEGYLTEILTRNQQEHFGKGRGQVYSLDGTEPLRSCNEVEVTKRLRTIRDRGYWFSEYNPSSVPLIWRPWVRSLRDQIPEWLRSLDMAVRQLVSSQRGGMPDVVAWNVAEPLRSAIFVECKGPREAFGEAQEDWLWAARQEGVELSQIAVSVRPF